MKLLFDQIRKVSCTLALALAITATFTTSALAQSADSATLAQVRTTYVSAGKNGTFEAFLQRLKALEEKHDTGMPRLVTRNRSGQNGYISISLMDDFSDLKPGANWVETYGAKEAAELSRMLAESVTGGQVQTFIVRRDLGRPSSIAPPDADAFITLLITVKQNGGPAYEEALTKLVEASAKVAPEVYWLAYSPDMHSDNVYRVVIPISWEDDSGPAMPIPQRYSSAFGEAEGAKWLKQLNDSIESILTMMTINRPDLSTIPE
jgi:hypothetical protein